MMGSGSIDIKKYYKFKAFSFQKYILNDASIKRKLTLLKSTQIKSTKKIRKLIIFVPGIRRRKKLFWIQEARMNVCSRLVEQSNVFLLQ